MNKQHPFVAASTWEKLSPHTWGGHPDASWLQGKGAFGGLLAGAWMRIFTSLVDDAARIPRSLTVHFCAPALPTHTTAHARLERRGALVTHLTGRMEQAGNAVTLASATFAGSRQNGPTYQDTRPPVLPPFDGDGEPHTNAIMPTFTQHFEYRFCSTSLPFMGADEAFIAAWVRPRGGLVLDAALACALLDAMPPAVFSRLENPAGGASVDFTIHLFHAFPLPNATADQPFLCTVRSVVGAHGYTEQLNQLWLPDGTLLGQCRQLVAVLA